MVAREGFCYEEALPRRGRTEGGDALASQMARDGGRMKKLSRLVAALCVLSAVFMLSAAPAYAGGTCGDGIPNNAGGECDPEGGLFIDGDPANDPCTTGSRCYFAFTCCKFNCQYVGTPGVPCQDGDSCSGPDICDQIGVCNGGPNVANGTPCDDGLFCTGVEDCQNGHCTSSTGNPCPGTACNICQEETDSCFNPNGSSCDDGSGCIGDGTCDGAGTCNGGLPVEGPCDDGLFCNGTDSCGGGACSVHSGDPCPGPNGDGNCNESCDEAADNCSAADPEDAACDDALFCNGTGTDICIGGTCTGIGPPSCDDDNSCTADICDEDIDDCSYLTAGDGTDCNDGDPCSLGDICAAGICVGSPPLLVDFCPWTVVLKEDAKKDQIKTNFQTVIDGDVCGGTIRFSSLVHVTSDVVADEATGTGQLRLAPDSTVDDDIVSAGAGAKAYPGSDDLPYTTAGTSLLPAGSLTPKTDVSGFYDLTGTHGLVADCHAARTAYDPRAADLDALGATQASIESINIATAGTLTITATVAGGLNVVDVDKSLRVGVDGVLELDGAGNPATVMVLRVAGKFQMLGRSTLSLTNGLTPDHTLVYGRGKKCQLGDLSFGAGTMFCTPARLKTGRTVAWLGALHGAGKNMKIGQKNALLYSPFQGL